MVNLGVSPLKVINSIQSLPVLLNGRLFGYIDDVLVDNFENAIRKYKADGTLKETIECAVLRRIVGKNPIFPGIFINSTEARLMRPVVNLRLNSIEWISPLE